MDLDARLIYIYAPERQFVMPYIEALTGAGALTEDASQASVCIMLSSTQVYAPLEGEDLGESTETNPNSPWFKAETEFCRTCAMAGKNPVILRCANIIGTGMTGWPWQLAKMIYRGTFFHFAGNQARLSTVHASDVARAVVSMSQLKTEGAAVFNLTDGSSPTLSELADSLAFRMTDKHIPTLSTKGQLWLGKLIYGKRLYRRFTTSLTLDSSKIAKVLDFQPTPVCHYLRTHNYEDSV